MANVMPDRGAIGEVLVAYQGVCYSRSRCMCFKFSDVSLVRTAGPHAQDNTALTICMHMHEKERGRQLRVLL